MLLAFYKFLNDLEAQMSSVQHIYLAKRTYLGQKCMQRLYTQAGQVLLSSRSSPDYCTSDHSSSDPTKTSSDPTKVFVGLVY